MSQQAASAPEVVARLKAEFPDARTELDWKNPLELLVATMLSAQTTDVQVNRVTQTLFAKYTAAEDYADAVPEELEEDIRATGFYRNKARSLRGMASALVEEHGGEVPRTMPELVALPGVGRKTANVVLNVAFGEPTIAVDTHIFRVGNRTNMAPGITPFEVELNLNRVVPTKYKLHAHHWLILHGRYTCIARKPLCEQCIINDLCRWPEKTAG